MHNYVAYAKSYHIHLVAGQDSFFPSSILLTDHLPIVSCTTCNTIFTLHQNQRNICLVVTLFFLILCTYIRSYVSILQIILLVTRKQLHIIYYYYWLEGPLETHILSIAILVTSLLQLHGTLINRW